MLAPQPTDTIYSRYLDLAIRSVFRIRLYASLCEDERDAQMLRCCAETILLLHNMFQAVTDDLQPPGPILD